MFGTITHHASWQEPAAGSARGVGVTQPNMQLNYLNYVGDYTLLQVNINCIPLTLLV